MSKRLFKSTAIVGLMTLLSRISGLARDVIIANFFGAKDQTDAFFVAFKIPNYFRRLFAEGGFSQAFVPVLSEYKNVKDETETQELIDYVCGTLAGILFLITVIGIIAAPILIYVFASGFSSQEGKFELTVDMLRITFPYLMLISLTAMAGGILNTYKRFTVPAFTPVLLNISIILAVIVLAPKLEEPITALAWGVLIAGIVQLAIQLPFLMQIRKLPKPKFQWRHSGVQKVFKLMLPTLFAGSVAQINIMISMIIASWLVSGSISWLYYSDRLMEFPLGVFGIALATVVLPHLSEQHVKGSPNEFAKLMDWALRWVFIIGMPAAVALIIISRPLISTIYFHGEFTANDLVMSQQSLVAYAIGLMSLILVKVLSNGFFARQDTKTPVRIAVFAMVVNIILSLLLVFPLKHAGLALATSLAATVNAGLLFYTLKKHSVIHIQPGWGRLLFQIFLGVGFMAVSLYMVNPEAAFWEVADLFDRIKRLAILVVLGSAVYFSALFVFGVRLNQLLLKTE